MSDRFDPTDLNLENSFDGKTFLELGVERDPRSTSNEDGHLEADDYWRHEEKR